MHYSNIMHKRGMAERKRVSRVDKGARVRRHGRVAGIGHLEMEARQDREQGWTGPCRALYNGVRTSRERENAARSTGVFNGHLDREQTMNQEQRGLRFGVIAVERGFITPAQLVAALKLQVEENLKESQHRLIGMILLDQGLITLDQIDEVLLEME